MSDNDDEYGVDADEFVTVRWHRLVEDVDGRPAGVVVTDEATMMAPEVLQRIRRQTKRRRTDWLT